MRKQTRTARNLSLYNYLVYSKLAIGAIAFGASVVFPIGAIAALIDMPMVLVGDKNNAADVDTDLGSVDYDYYIGTYEVTSKQYAIFLNSVAADGDIYGLYHNQMGYMKNGSYPCGIVQTKQSDGKYTYTVWEGYEDRPVNYISFWDALRFCNWLTTNGTDTETGMYDLTDTAAILNNTVTRNPIAWENGGFALPTEDEWYKAAYFKKGTTDEYWRYPMQTNSISAADANFGRPFAPEMIKNVGSSGGTSSYGTYDQGGNVSELTETAEGDDRVVRGGWARSSAEELSSLSSRLKKGVINKTEDHEDGFRIVSRFPLVIPEPGTYALFGGVLLGGVILLRYRRRK